MTLRVPEGAREAVAQWAILRSRKRPERVNRNERRVEAKAMPAATIEVAYRFESGQDTRQLYRFESYLNHKTRLLF